MTAPVVFLDTETTGLGLDADIWEFAAIRRHPTGEEIELHLFIEHAATKCADLPDSFLADHRRRWPNHAEYVWTQAGAAEQIARFLAPDFYGGKAHIVGAVPDFDMSKVEHLLGRHGFGTQWHYHLIDVENLAVGYLRGRRDAFAAVFDDGLRGDGMTPLPWDSDELSHAIGVEPPTTERHTALGDARWARDIYDRVMGTNR